MKTFTTYAEKKAKQFFNLLQGYTKGIRITAILILLLMGVSNMSAADITSDGTARLYFNMSTYDWWISGNGDNNFAYFFKDSKSAWSAHSVNYSGNTYYVVIPEGTWNTVILTRNNTTTTPSWDNKWNQTGNITLSSSSNYISKFSENSTSVTWGTAVKPASTGSLSASSTSVNIGANVTLTPSLTSNQTINDIKSTTYSISPSSGASINGNTFTATAAGTYTITATITYNPRGYASLTSTTTATTTITVKSLKPTTIYLKPGDWKNDNARLMVFAWKTAANTDGEWFEMSEIGCDREYFTYELPADYTAFSLCRLDPNLSIGWDAKWNQSKDYTIDNEIYYLQHDAWGQNGGKCTFTKTNSAPVITYAITLNRQSGTTGDESVTATYGSAAPSAEMPTRTGYTFEGYYTQENGQGDLYIDKNGAWQNIDYIVDGKWMKPACNLILYAKWTEKNYTVTINNDGNGTTSPSGVQNNVGQITGVSITATPAANYEFVNWTITSGSGSFGSETSASTTFKPTSAATIQANFRSIATYHLDVQAGNGISQVGGAVNDITLGEKFAIKATPKTGYTFNEWTANPAANAEFADARSENTTVTVKNGSVTVTATGKEQLCALTTANSYSTGNPGYTNPTKSRNDIGVETTAEVTATAAGADYIFTGWTLTNCERTDGGADNATTITVRSNGDGKAATVTANYTAKTLVRLYYSNTNNWSKINAYLWTDGNGSDNNTWPGTEITNNVEVIDCEKYYYYEYYKEDHPDWNRIIFNDGSNQTSNIIFSNSTNNGQFYIKDAWIASPGPKWTLAGTMNEWNTDLNPLICSDATSGYVELQLTANTDYEFKFVDKHNNEWYGVSSTVTQITYTNQATARTMNGNNNANKQTIRTAGAGVYRFTWDITNKKVTVIYPTSYTVTYSQTPDAAAGAPTTTPSVASGKYVAADTDVTFTAQAPETGYTFKGWYDNSEGTGTALSSNLAYTCTINANTTVYAVYIENKYKVVAIANPAAYGTVTPETATTMSESNGGDITATPRNGYQLDNWTIKSGTGYFGETGTNTTSTTANTKFRPTADSEVQANFSAITYTINYNLDGGTNNAGNPATYTIETPTITLKDPTKTGYTFNGWYSEAGFTNQVTQIATGSTGDKNLYAKWTEKTVTVSPTNAYDKGNPGYANPTASNSGKIGFSSSSQLVAPSPGEGYTFAGWTLSDNIVVITGNASSNRTITVRHKTGDGSAVSAVANYNENLESTYYVRGGKKFANSWDVLLPMTKKSGEADQKIVYYTVNIDATNNGNTANSDFQFKIYDKTGNGTWWGLQTDNCNEHAYWYGRATTGEQTMTQCSNIDLRADAVGAYEIKVDYTDANPKITVNFPSASLSLVGSFNSWNESANPFIDNSDDNTATASITLNEGEYEFKIKEESFWRTNTGTVERYSNNTDIDFSQSSTNTNLIADIPGTYTFVYNKETHKLTVQYPTLTIRLAGEFNGWNKSDDNYKFTEDPAKPGTYTLAKEFVKRERWEACGKEQAEYEFKLNISGTDYTVEGNGNQKLLQYTRQNTTKVVNDGTSYNGPYYNLLLQADITGEYLFTYDHKTRKMTVTHPEYTPAASYIVGDFSDNKPGTDAMPCNPNNSDEGHDWTEKYGKPFENGTADCVEFEDGTWHFKIKINGIWYGADIDPITTSGVYTLDDEYADTGEKNVTLTTNDEDGCYYFEYTLNGDGTLSVLIIFPNDRRTVTFDMQGRGTQVDPQHVLYNQTAVKPYVSDVDGYLFAGWYTDAPCTKEYDFNTPVTQDITLYAKWIPYGDCIFYKNNLNWDEVYVYFYSSDKYWTDDKGTGAKYNKTFTRDEDTNHSPHYRKFRGKMTRIGLTDIWYFDYISAAKQIDPTNWEQIKDHTDNAENDINYSNIAFTAHEQYDHSFFDNTKVIRRGDFKPDMQLFIPQTDQTPTYLNKHDGVSAKYYNKGLWLKYNSTESGYNWSSNVGNWDNNTNYFTSEIAGGYSFTAEVELNAGSTHQFKIHNQNGTWYGNPGTMTQDNCTNWWFKEEVKDNAKIQPTVTGTYIFTAYLGDGKVMISLDYPLSTGDYRLAYLDIQAGSFHPGHYIKKRTKVEEKRDTVSFFVVHDKTPEIQLQECTNITSEGIATWETIATYSNINSIATATTVYNFILKQTNINGTHARSVETSETHLYTGDYYIRTDAAAGGWKSFRQEGNKMTYNSYADEHEDFDHYFCEWVSQDKGLKNVSYTVANDYSYCISDTLHDDVDTNHPIIVSNNDPDKKGDLPANNDGTLKDANVRFGWDSKTNKIRRAYIAGSGHKKDRFLVLQGNEYLTDINGNRYIGKTAEGQDRFNLTDDEVVLDDMGNWIYQMDVQANKDTRIQLTALYNELVQYFKGTETVSVALLASTATTNYKIRLIYDFKTNHLVIAWLAGGEKIDGDEQELGADMMIIRRNQDPAEQLNFDPTTRQLTGVETAYAVITFDKYFLNNKDKTGNELAEKKSENERKFYWISFPFDVKLSDVFGFGEYGDQWIMEYYDGEARAKEGYWAETETFWKYITNKNYVLKAGQGYVLCLNLNKMGFTSTVFAHTTEVSLYFPSTGPLNTITGELPTAVTVPAHECTIERDNRNIYDSNWNLIGVPGFADIEEVTIGGSSHTEFNDDINADCVSFYYKYLPGTNTYSAKTQTETFQTMYAYMVQFEGTINWKAKTMPAQLAARRTGSMPSQHDLRLEIAQGEETDQTFVQLKEADATAEFDMNVDMTKIFNSGMNIYTLTGSNAIQVAGNALPIAKATIPVGVVTATAGEYTFRMPDGTDGIAVTLVDNVTGTHTNMLMNEYTVTLNAGTIENRFYLVVDPDRTATSVENVGSGANGDEAKGVEKFLIDGKLFIRTTDGIFDAKGQRL